MKTENYHRNIDMYLSQLKHPSDKITQFYDACITAKNALIEVDILNKKIQEMVKSETDGTGKSIWKGSTVTIIG